MTVVDHRLRLMRDRRAETADRLRNIELRIAGVAEAGTRSNDDLPSTFGRHASDWTSRHEADYQRRLSELRSETRNEIGAIKRKLARQTEAISAHHLKQAGTGRG